MGTLRKRYIGDRAFYMMVLSIAVPIVIQNGFTNIVNMLDNVMVGRIGTEQMSGVAIANQLLFVFNLSIFGATSGASIFGSQYFGNCDDEGVRNTFRFKILLGIILVLIASAVFSVYGERLIGLFLSGSDDGGDLAATLDYGYRYLLVMLLGLPGYMVTQAFSSTLRDGSETVLPMKAGVIAVITNLIGNWLLIFGNLGLPRLGVVGAAIATVTSRYVEAAVVIIGTYRRKHEFTYLKGMFRTLLIPRKVLFRILKAAIPLLVNESLWSLGNTFMTQCYSTRGLSAVAGFNIANTILNVFNVTFLAVGTSVSIIIGQLLGAGKTEEAVDTDRKLIAFAVFVGALAGAVMASISHLFPLLYNTSDMARKVATQLIIAQGCFLPVFGFKNSTYFTLRSGGKIWVTILFDSAYLWSIGVPIAYCVSRFTDIGVVGIFLAVQMGDILKCILGIILVRKKIWVRKIVG